MADHVMTQGSQYEQQVQPGYNAEWLANVNAISLASNIHELAQTVGGLIRQLGGDRYVFMCVPPQGDMTVPKEDQIVFNCDRAWLLSYLERKWYVNDPGLAYVRRRATPTVSSELPLATEGQRVMREHDRAYGFRSKLVVPAHLPVSGRAAALYIGKDNETCEGEPDLMANRALFRVIASELLEWFDSRMRENAIRTLRLTDREFRILGLLRNEYSADQIASELHLAVPTVYSCYKKLNLKFEVTHIRLAVRQATYLGLLEH